MNYLFLLIYILNIIASKLFKSISINIAEYNKLPTQCTHIDLNLQLKTTTIYLGLRSVFTLEISPKNIMLIFIFEFTYLL